jgi:hypothetical protein
VNVLLRVLDRVTKPPLLAVLAAVLALGTAVIAVQYLASRQDVAVAGDEVGTGDFMAFYTGASLIAQGRGAELYDYHAQAVVQRQVLGEPPNGFQGYLNPPLLAVAIAPMVRFGYLASFYAFGAASLAALGAAAAAVRRHLPHLGATPIDAFTTAALALSFNPVIRSAIGGQNTAITLSLLALLYVGLKGRNAALAGIALGLLTYKPQYFVVMAAVLALRGELAVLAVATLVGAAHYAIGALICGPAWPMAMLRGLAAYGPLEIATNGGTHFSWIRATAFSLPPAIGPIVGKLGALITLGVVALSARRFPAGDPRFGPAFALWVTGTMLASPHLQYYDAGLLVLPALLVLERFASEGPVPLPVRLGIATVWLGYPAYIYGPLIGVQPLAIALVAAFLFVVWLVFGDA